MAAMHTTMNDFYIRTINEHFQYVMDKYYDFEHEVLEFNCKVCGKPVCLPFKSVRDYTLGIIRRSRNIPISERRSKRYGSINMWRNDCEDIFRIKPTNRLLGYILHPECFEAWKIVPGPL